METSPGRGGAALDHRQLSIDLLGDEASPRQVEGECRHGHPSDDPDQCGLQQSGGRGLEQDGAPEQREHRHEAQRRAEQRPEPGDRDRAKQEEVEQLPSSRPADPEQSVLTSLSSREQGSRVRRKEGGQDGPGQPEEHEHPLRDRSVTSGYLERVGDVVDQVVLLGGDRLDLRRDLAGLGDRGRGISIQDPPVDQHVEFLEGKASGPRPELGGRMFEGRCDLTFIEVMTDHDRVGNVLELLEARRLPALEERPGAGQIRDPAHVQGQGHCLAGHRELDGIAFSHLQGARRLDADERITHSDAAGHDLDARVVSLVRLVEREEFDRAGDGCALGGDRSCLHVHGHQGIGEADAGDPTNPPGQGRERRWFRRTGSDGSERFAR